MIFNSFWQPGLLLGAMEVKQHSMFLKGGKNQQGWPFAHLLHCLHHIILPLLLIFFFSLNIPAYSAPFVLSVLSIHDPWGFTAIVDLKLRWLEDKGVTRPLQCPLNTLIPGAKANKEQQILQAFSYERWECTVKTSFVGIWTTFIRKDTFYGDMLCYSTLHNCVCHGLKTSQGMLMNKPT